MSIVSKLMFKAALKKVGSRRLYRYAAEARRADLVRLLRQRVGQRVLAGPFKDMLLPDGRSWGDGDFAPKLLGTYELELHPFLLAAAARAPQAIVNVGCAEGFYAVGLARLMPEVPMFAFDIDNKALAVCETAAKANDVAGRVSLHGLCTTAELAGLLGRYDSALAFLDCEGGEAELLDPAKVPQLAKCDILVETHEHVLAGITEELVQRLSPTHRIERIHQGARNPHGLAALHGLGELERWLLVNETRPVPQTWLACWRL
jgi:hypothetical protein